MKKAISLFLCVVMILGAFSGCNSGQTPTENTNETTQPQLAHVLQVGYGRADVTPRQSVPLSGLSNSVVGGSTSDRMHKDVRNPLYATCIALTDETGNTVLVYHLDFLLSYASSLTFVKIAIAKEFGINGNQIMITSTHNHSGPDVTSSLAVMEDYREQLEDWMVEAARQAMADRKPAKMYITDVELEKMNFVRHYLMNDGTYVGDNFGSAAGKTYVKHVVDADNQMQLIKFTREGSKDIVLMNWQGHPTGHGDFRYSILSCVDETRKVVEKEMDCHFAYFLGASGNVNSSSRIKGEQITTTGVYYEELYQKLGMEAVKAAANFKQVQTGSIRFLSYEYTAKDKTDAAATKLVPMYAFSFGEVAFVTAAYEMFTENGMGIKEGSPYEMTFVATCSNEGAYLAYIPSEYAFGYNSYEAQMSRVAPGTAEILEKEYIALLNRLQEGA